MIVALGLPLNVAAIILGCILSMLLSVFNTLGPISILPLLPWHWLSFSMSIQWLASIHCQFCDIWYLWCECISSIVCKLCLSYVLRPMQLALVVDLFRVLTLNVAICIFCLHFSSFCLSSVADFSNTEARTPTSAGRVPFLPARRAMRFMYVV